MKHLILLSFVLLLLSCGEKKQTGTPVNKFSDAEQLRIAQLADERNTTALLEYIKSPDLHQRVAAVTALAAAGDTAMAGHVLTHLNKESQPEVRSACYYSLGFMIQGNNAAQIAQTAMNETDPIAEPAALECLGRIAAALRGNDEQSETLEKVLQNLKDHTLNSEESRLGWARAAFHYHLSGQTDNRLMDRMPWVLQKTEAGSRQMCAFAMTRFKGDWFEQKKNQEYVLNWCKSERNSDVRVLQMNMLARCKTKDAADMITSYLTSGSQNQQVKVAAIRASAQLKDVPIDALLIPLRDSDNYVAAEALSAMKLKDFNAIIPAIETSIQNRSAEIQASGLSLMNTGGVWSETIIKRFDESKEDYDKVHYAHAMASDQSLLSACLLRLESEKSFAVKYALTETVLAYRQQGKWPTDASFEDTCIQLFNTGDIGIQALVASALREANLSGEQKKIFTDLLLPRLESLVLPREIETFNEIVKTINHFGLVTLSEKKVGYNHPIDWKLVSSISQDQRATIHTSRGDIIIELKVNESPGSVASFVSLAKEGFYNNKYFHRVIPNFVIQGGCPRGDGMGSTDYTLRTELSLPHFSEGAVGLASSGNDTESCQWFITHMATPHLNGRYTIFGYVVEGMEVVRAITVGDKITGIDV